MWDGGVTTQLDNPSYPTSTDIISVYPFHLKFATSTHYSYLYRKEYAISQG